MGINRNDFILGVGRDREGVEFAVKGFFQEVDNQKEVWLAPCWKYPISAKKFRKKRKRAGYSIIWYLRAWDFSRDGYFILQSKKKLGEIPIKLLEDIRDKKKQVSIQTACSMQSSMGIYKGIITSIEVNKIILNNKITIMIKTIKNITD